MNLGQETAYASLVGVASSGKSGAIRVIPGDPENGSFLTQGQMLVIRRWIELGAPND